MTIPAENSQAHHRMRLTLSSGAWILILALIGAVQLLREQWFDAALFFVAATVLTLDALLGRSRARPSGMPRLAIALLVLGGIVAAALPRHSPQMQALVCGIGLLAILTAWRQSSPVREIWPWGAVRLARLWAFVLIAGCLWELGQFLLGRARPAEPAYALSDLLDPSLSTGAGRALFALVWVAVGGFLLARARR